VSFLLLIYKIYTYCLLKGRLGVSKVSLCIYLVFGFFGVIWLFYRVDLAFFAYDYLATLLQTEDISILKHRAVSNCVKMSMILLFYYVEGRRFSDEIGLIFEIYLLLVDHSEILVFNK